MKKARKIGRIITLAQFVANYTVFSVWTICIQKGYSLNWFILEIMTWLKTWTNAEIVTHHFPFRNKDEELLVETKFIDIYDHQEELFLAHRKKFVASLDIEKTIEISNNLCHEDEYFDDDEAYEVSHMFPQPNLFHLSYNDPNTDIISNNRWAGENLVLLERNKKI